MENNSFTLFLMSKKGLSALKKLIEEGLSTMIDKVIISHDNNMLNDYYNEIIEECKKANISNFDKADDYSINSKYCVAISWRWMIKVGQETTLIVFHDSLLPRYRGFSPLVNMLINKEPYIGVTALYANDEYDKGDIVEQKKIRVDYPIKIADAIDLITPLYSDILCDILRKAQNGCKFISHKQDEASSSYSLWRNEDDYRISWSQSSEEILQFIYSVGYPYKGASSLLDGKLVRIHDCELYHDVRIENRTPGKVIFVEGLYPVVVCGKGLIKLTKVSDSNDDSILPLKKFRSCFL